MKNYDDDLDEDFDNLRDDDFDSGADSDDDFYEDDEEDTSGPVTDEGALYFDMVQKLYATIEEHGAKDPSLVQLEASLNKLTDGKTEDADENTFYLEEAITIVQQIKKHTKNSPNVKRIYDNIMLDIVRFTDESAPGHQGDLYL